MPTPADMARSIARVNGSSWPSGASRVGTVTDWPGNRVLKTPGSKVVTCSPSITSSPSISPAPSGLVMNPISALLALARTSSACS